MKTRADQIMDIFFDFISYIEETLKTCEISVPACFSEMKNIPQKTFLPQIITEVDNWNALGTSEDSDKKKILSLGFSYTNNDTGLDIKTKMEITQKWVEYVLDNPQIKEKLLLYVKFLYRLVHE